MTNSLLYTKLYMKRSTMYLLHTDITDFFGKTAYTVTRLLCLSVDVYVVEFICARAPHRLPFNIHVVAHSTISCMCMCVRVCVYRGKRQTIDDVVYVCWYIASSLNAPPSYWGSRVPWERDLTRSLCVHVRMFVCSSVWNIVRFASCRCLAHMKLAWRQSLLFRIQSWYPCLFSSVSSS